MITYDYIIEAQTKLVEFWGEDGKRVIETCARVNPYNKPVTDFLKECTACGGNWGGMLLTGIKKLYPEVWDCIPEDMGIMVWPAICYTLLLCGIDTSEDA